MKAMTKAFDAFLVSTAALLLMHALSAGTVVVPVTGGPAPAEEPQVEFAPFA